MSDICAHMALSYIQMFIEVPDINKTCYSLGVGGSHCEFFCLLGCDIV